MTWSCLSLRQALYPSRHAYPEVEALASASVHQFTAPDGAQFSLYEFQSGVSRAAIVCLHGYYANRRQVAAMADAVSQKGIAVYLLELRGHGDRPGPFTFGVRESEDVHTVLNWLANSRSHLPVHLMGWSMGSAVMCQVALRANNICSLISDGVFDRLLPLMRRRVWDTFRMPGFLAHLTWWTLEWHLKRKPAEWDPAVCATRLEMPLLAMHGDEDQRVFIEEGLSFYEHWRGPKQWETFKGAAHVSLFAHDPQRYADCVSEFVLSHTPEAA